VLSARIFTRIALVGVLAAGGLTACGGSDVAEAPAAEATVSVKKVPGYGEVLATKDGKLLFVLTSDPENGSKCTDDCAKQWPPLSESGELTAADGVDRGKVSSFEREDGTTQVTYNKRALYTYTGEELAGPGTKALGGTWFFISPDGKPVDSTEAGGY